jgi:tetratricopeptide (TPR) repeat protein
VFIASDDLLMNGALKKMLRTYLELAKIAYKSELYDEARAYLQKSIESYPEFRRSFKYFKLQTKIYFKKVFCHSQ